VVAAVFCYLARSDPRVKLGLLRGLFGLTNQDVAFSDCRGRSHPEGGLVELLSRFLAEGVNLGALMVERRTLKMGQVAFLHGVGALDLQVP